MGRGRSPSPRRERPERRRSRSRERVERERIERERPRHRHRRSRSRSPVRNRSRSPHRHRSRSPPRRRSSSPGDIEIIHDIDDEPQTGSTSNRPKIKESDLKGMDPETADMMRTMGFGEFDTTKGKRVEGNDISAVNVITKRKFRQYMNRRGGFNRPLDFIA